MPQMMNGWNTIVGLYDSPQDIDLYVGVLNEVHMQGAQVGPTAGCIIAGNVYIRVDQGGLSGDCPETVQRLSRDCPETFLGGSETHGKTLNTRCGL